METHLITANNPKISKTTLFIYPFSTKLFYLFFTLNYFIYLLSEVEWGAKMFDNLVYEHPYSLIWVFAAEKWNMGGSGLLQKQ